MKAHIMRIKRQATDWKKIFLNNIPDKRTSIENI